MKKVCLILAGFLISNVSFADHHKKTHYEEKRELTPSENLIFAVKGLTNSLIGFSSATAFSYESKEDLMRIDQLLQEGADINYQDIWGYTALNYAAYYGYPLIAKHLIEMGADPNIIENKSYNPCQMARHYLSKNQRLLQNVKTDEHLKNKHEMLLHYESLITRYFEVYNLLYNVTEDCNLKSSSWF